MSFLLDTNALSEILRSLPDPTVLRWFASQAEDQLFVSAVTQAEMVLGARLLPQGKRQQRLQGALQELFEHDFAHRVLPFDARSVVHYAEIVASRRSIGRPISQFDAQIAAIALQHGMALATRNTRDFEGCGLRLIDPWTSRG
jgi:predicted nucleic acid-binding protein